MKTSTPGFCNPMAFNMPPYTSATRGVGFPSQGTLATPFVTTAPSLFKSTNSAYSIPEPKVPDAVITGFFNSIPAIFIFVSMFSSFLFPAGIKYPHLLPKIQVHPYIFSHSLHGNGHLFPLSCIRIPNTHLHRRPFFPLRKYMLLSRFPPHTA